MPTAAKALVAAVVQAIMPVGVVKALVKYSKSSLLLLLLLLLL